MAHGSDHRSAATNERRPTQNDGSNHNKLAMLLRHSRKDTEKDGPMSLRSTTDHAALVGMSLCHDVTLRESRVVSKYLGTLRLLPRSDSPPQPEQIHQQLDATNTQIHASRP